MKICYLTWGETPRSYGVFGSQVIGQFIETSKLMPKSKFYFISGIPLIHSGHFREKNKYSNEIKKIKKKLDNVSFLKTPIFTSQNFVNSSKYTFNLMHFFAHFFLAKKIKKIRPDVLHCRSYHATWAAIKVKIKYGFKYEIIFDARGIWPEEVAHKKGYNKENENYKFLKNIELFIINNVDSIVAVSDTMRKHFLGLGANNVHTIYLSTPVSKLSPNLLKKSKGDVITFCYVGALSNNTWHRIDDLLKLFLHLNKTIENANFVIVTTSNHKEIKKSFIDFPIEKLKITSTKNIQELQIVLRDVDYGVMSYFNPSTDKELLLSNMVMAVKTAEYIGAGLPMIVNKFCGGAAAVINNNNLGISYNPNTFDELTKEKIISVLKEKTNIERSRFAEEFFDYKSNAFKYRDLYVG